ncbi:hypothetical protein C8J57DRAFT_1510859 [Mycena rebaudengoi]|nr:hypothetical protein C8J57DRAFT_1510859 [Mycena rebaudengoi]
MQYYQLLRDFRILGKATWTRMYGARQRPKDSLRDVQNREWKLLILILIVAAAVRLFRLSKPSSVVYSNLGVPAVMLATSCTPQRLSSAF